MEFVVKELGGIADDETVEMEGAAVADESEIRKDVEVEESLETSFRKVVGALWSRLLS